MVGWLVGFPVRPVGGSALEMEKADVWIDLVTFVREDEMKEQRVTDHLR